MFTSNFNRESVSGWADVVHNGRFTGITLDGRKVEGQAFMTDYDYCMGYALDDLAEIKPIKTTINQRTKLLTQRGWVDIDPETLEYIEEA